jgi:hypothetical protein
MNKNESSLYKWQPSLEVTLLISFIVIYGLFFLFLVMGNDVLASGHLPGEDASDKLEAAGTLLRLLDTGLFKWGARIFAGLCIMASAWSLKEQRFGVCVICIVAAIIFGTAPTWVKNIFNMGNTDSIFSKIELPIVEKNGETFKYV